MRSSVHVNQGLYGDWQEEMHQRERIEKGIDPDEHTIYKVLCPAIRAKWSKQEEIKRRVTGKKLEALVHIFRDPEAYRARYRVG